tara:strand:- start:624 stop:1376 length:753 start_codon:yes stop_codon:yes gene_type:complete
MASPSTRQQLIDFCLRKLGDPVIEINVDEDQIQDKVDDALQYYREFHSDATKKIYLKHLVTSTDVTNEYIPISSDIIQVSKLFPLSGIVGGTGIFNIKYQMMLSDVADMTNFMGNLAYYEQMQQYLSTLDMQLTGTPQVNFVRRENRLYIFGDFADKDIKAGDYIIAEVYQIISEDNATSIWNDMFLKDYTCALIKQQWGQNLIKFEGMTLPGGVTLNGRQIYDDATADIDKLKENVRLEHELPPDFMVG